MNTLISVTQKPGQFVSVASLFFVFVCVFCLSPVQAHEPEQLEVTWLTDSERQWIEQNPVIRIGVDVDYPPYEFLSHTGEVVGIAPDYLKLISESTGLRFEVVHGLNWGDIITRLRRRQLDMTPVITVTRDRRKNIIFTHAYLENPYVIVIRDDTSDIDDELSLRGKKVALVQSYGVTEMVLEKASGVIPLFYNSELESLKSVSSGKTAATVGRLGGLAYQIQTQNLSNLKVAGMAGFSSSGLAMGIRNDWPELRSILDKSLQHISDEQRNEIYQRWIKVKHDKWVDFVLTAKITIGFLICLVLLFLWNRKLKGTVTLKGGQLKRESALRKESESRFATLFENASEAIAVIDVETGFLCETNANAVSLFGLSKEQLSGRPIWYLCPTSQPGGQDSKCLFNEKLQEVMESDCPMFEWVYQTLGEEGKGEERPCEMRLVKLPGENRIRCSMIDIFERKKSEKDIALLAEVFSSAIEGAIIADKELNILRVNQAFTNITGYSSTDVIGKKLRMLLADGISKTFFTDCSLKLKQYGVWQGELMLKGCKGNIFPTQQSISAVKDNDGNIIQWVSLFADISEKKQSEDHLYRLAHYDLLTGLPNRTYFNDCLEKAVSLCDEKETGLALLTLDLDHFKNINDSLGHPVGDAILLEVAKRFKETLRISDLLARLGGDEFVMLLENKDAPGYASHVAANLISALVPSFWVDGMKLNISASIGISLCCDGTKGDRDPATLVKNSEAAMYLAKENGRNNYALYTPELTDRALECITLGAELRHAIEEEQGIEVWYQPQFNLETSDIFGVEALVRWRHPDRGLIPPDRFIQIAEDQGMINALGQQVLRQACKDMKGWLQQGVNLNVVAVNVSGHQVQSADFEKVVYETLTEEKLEPHFLQIEITESVVMDRALYTIEMMERLRAMGITIAIDDFGTGYSSLSYLKQLPVNKLKIDRSFVTGLPGDTNDEAIVKAIIALSESLNLEVIAEGIETSEQQRMLFEAGCNQGQGYLKGKPMPASDLESVMANVESESRRA